MHAIYVNVIFDQKMSIKWHFNIKFINDNECVCGIHWHINYLT